MDERLSLACSSVILFPEIAGLLKAAHSLLPGIALKIRILDSAAQEENLFRRVIAAGIGPSRIGTDSIGFEALFEERLIMIAPARFRDVPDIAVGLRGVPFLALAGNIYPELGIRVGATLEWLSAEPPVRLGRDIPASMIAEVARGEGWTILPRYALDSGKSEHVRAIDLGKTIDIGIRYRKDDRSNVVTMLLEAARTSRCGNRRARVDGEADTP